MEGEGNRLHTPSRGPLESPTHELPELSHANQQTERDYITSCTRGRSTYNLCQRERELPHLAQLSLDVEEAPLFPGIHKHEAVGVGSQALMLLHLLQFLSPAQGERRQSISSLTASLPIYIHIFMLQRRASTTHQTLKAHILL